MFAPDWVVFLDADEFVDVRGHRGGLPDRLAGVPQGVPVVKLPTVDYVARAGDDIGELLIPARMRWHPRNSSGTLPHVAVRATAAAPDLRIRSGAHNVFRGPTELASLDEQVVRLAHYPRRNAWQMVTKNVLGRLKLLAAGGEAQAIGLSTHYTSVYETLRDRPHELLADPAFLHPVHSEQDIVLDPLHYLGGALRHTSASDPAAKTIRALIGYAETLAQQFGVLADNNAGIRLQKAHDVGQWRRLI
jgi:hypothetical protein